jgi:hypothetical protein
MRYSAFVLTSLFATAISAQGELRGCVEKEATPGEQNAHFNTFLDLLYSKDASKRDVNKAINEYYSKDVEDSSPRVSHKPGTMVVASLAEVAGTLSGITGSLNVTEIKREFDFGTGVGTSIVMGEPKGAPFPYVRRTLTDKYTFGKGKQGACIHIHEDNMVCENINADGTKASASCGGPPPKGGAPPKGPARFVRF